MIRVDTLGAIDIGSNAIRLMIANVETYSSGAVDVKKVAFLRVPIRLGEDVFVDGAISDEKQSRLIDAMNGFSYIIKSFKAIKYRACATSAMREAKNGDQVIERVFNETGVRIDVISGDEEADTIYAAGGISSAIDGDKSYLYIDVGGGSTEVVVYSNKQKVAARSFKLGTVRMLTEMVKEDEFDKFKEWLKEQAKNYQPTGIIGSGGNINKVQRMLGKKDKEIVNSTEMRVLFESLKSMNYEERIHNLGLNTYRADVILPALKIFVTASKVCKINDIIVPRVGLADGIIKQLHNELIKQS